ncbi:hypothetical protein EC396_05945 [Lutibacter sp. HS1-25]|uniref:hypothetical protein n=1 Tax=Lutibacter sp. HS1-25 TaxID=2485000 RepID=UPI0010136C14|nr:hypothetical protein [Lutibacter sp. HS1-25]RXP58599.1 hypothetical protein EC396_05945 [Lutibacter sp. HS1-25]
MAVLKKIAYIKKHPNKISALNEVDSISTIITKLGYINNTYLLTEKDSIIDCEFTLNKKIEIIRVYYPENSIDQKILKQLALNTSNSYFDIFFNSIENTIYQLIQYFENSGHPFTSIYLSDISQQNDLLSAKLNLNISSKRTVDNIIIKGYPEFPEKYLKHYLNIKTNETFNINDLTKLSELINTIPFITQIKKPEVLFTKDSTSLYLYLTKKSNSNFDGIIGFSNEDNRSSIQFNGYLDLNLNNVLNKGESFGIHWENTQDLNSSLKLNFNSPYIFNSNFIFNGSFSIFRQDSSYVNTNGHIKLGHEINQKNLITLTGSNEKSNLSSTSNTSNNTNSFTKKMLGVSYTFNIPEKSIYNNRYKFYVDTGFLIGNRKSENSKTQQNIFELSANYIANLNTRNSILLKTTTQLLNTSNPFENELFRIGGINSIRGFNEQSILTSKYNITTIEYHYLTNKTSYLYTITDLAILNNINTQTTTQIYGVGLGYFLTTKRTILNLSYAVGSNYDTSFNINNSKIHIKITYPF